MSDGNSARDQIIVEGIKVLAHWIIGFHYQDIGGNCLHPYRSSGQPIDNAVTLNNLD